MSIFYIVAEKSRSGLKSGNLSRSNYGEFEANSPQFTHLCNSKKVWLFRDVPQDLTPDKILLKVEANDIEIKDVAMKTNRGGKSISFVPGTEDATRTYAGNPASFKIKVISQIMPSGEERYKHNAELEEKKLLDSPKDKKGNVFIRAATIIAQKAIDIREKDIGKDLTDTKPFRRI